MATITHASEAGHFYTITGEPMYEVPMAKGNGMRPTTLRDARKLNLVPSVTTIIRCAAAPGLQRWRELQVLHAALTLPRDPAWSEEQFLDAIMADSQEQARKAAERGVAVHAAIQGGYEGKIPFEEFIAHWNGTHKTVNSWAVEQWDAEKSFSHPLGFGGKSDLSSPRGFVLDFKTKEFTAENLPKAYDEHALQLAAYRVGLGIPTARCAIVFVSVTVPGLAHLVEISAEELDKGWRCFKALLDYWQSKNNYRPSFEKKAA